MNGDQPRLGDIAYDEVNRLRRSFDRRLDELRREMRIEVDALERRVAKLERAPAHICTSDRRW